MILATSPEEQLRRPEDGVRLAEQAAALGRPGDVRVLDTLAAAYAATGDFDHAIEILNSLVGDAVTVVPPRMRACSAPGPTSIGVGSHTGIPD